MQKALSSIAADNLGPLIPDSLCDQSCLKADLTTGLNIALASMGIPPSLPNFAELQEQGLDYLAAKAVESAESELPPGSLEAAKAAGVDPKATVKDAIKKSLSEIQKGYADSVGWLPDGVPVRPDGMQPPVAQVKLTRSAGDKAGECSGGMLTLTSKASLAANAPVSNFNSFKVTGPKLAASTSYQLFEDGHVPLPCWPPANH